jgi:hypothetical protein
MQHDDKNPTETAGTATLLCELCSEPATIGTRCLAHDVRQASYVDERPRSLRSARRRPDAIIEYWQRRNGRR